LLLLCNDKAVLGPWTNSRGVNLFTGAVIAALVMLSIILTASVLFPDITEAQILAVLVGGGITAFLTTLAVRAYERRRAMPSATAPPVDASLPATWRMPPLRQLPPARLTLLNRTWMIVLRANLFVADGLLLFKIVQLAVNPGSGG
jgi:hypothetical protein